MSTRINFSELPPGFMPLMMQMNDYVEKTGLDTKLLELMRFRVSQINHCAYCLDMHFKEAQAAGEKAKRLYSLSARRETSYYSDKERAVLEWSEMVTLPKAGNNQEKLFGALSKFFNKEEIANLTLAIVEINAWNRLARLFGFEAGKYQVK